jgi:Holliday junction resolvase RusA-like endonuclease
MHAPFHNPAELIIALPMPPTTNNLFATDRSSRRRFRTADYLAWVKSSGYRLNAQRPLPMAGRVALLIELEEPKTARAQDCTNRIKAVEDLLVAHRIIEGDDQRYVREVTVRWAPVEGCKVTVRPCE